MTYKTRGAVPDCNRRSDSQTMIEHCIDAVAAGLKVRRVERAVLIGDLVDALPGIAPWHHDSFLLVGDEAGDLDPGPAHVQRRCEPEGYR